MVKSIRGICVDIEFIDKITGEKRGITAVPIDLLDVFYDQAKGGKKGIKKKNRRKCKIFDI